MRQLSALLAVAGRQLAFGVCLVGQEADRLRAEVIKIRHPQARAQALANFEQKRTYLDGAALFWVLLPRRNPGLLRLLVALQVLANHLDTESEQDARRRQSAGGGWLIAIEDAVDLSRTADQRAAGVYQSSHCASFLVALVDACRARCKRLPGYPAAQGTIVAEARRGASMDIEHNPVREHRDRALRAFADREFDSRAGMSWWEITAASTSLLTLMAALTLAGSRDVGAEDLHATVEAYRWVALLSALLDNYVDRPADRLTEANNYFDMYESDAMALTRLITVADRALRQTAALRAGERHVVVVAAMIAMFLSNRNALLDDRRPNTQHVVSQSGSLTRALHPVLRAWRSAAGLVTE